MTVQVIIAPVGNCSNSEAEINLPSMSSSCMPSVVAPSRGG